jgi:hypothetical protein
MTETEKYIQQITNIYLSHRNVINVNLPKMSRRLMEKIFVPNVERRNKNKCSKSSWNSSDIFACRYV